MQRAISLLLVLTLLLSGCGGAGEKKETVAAEIPAEASVEVATEAPTTAPTVSPEEMLYDSLPDRMKQAVDAGIVELTQLEDLSRTVTVGEASAMLQKAYVHRTGVASKALAELMNTPEYADLTADRGWVLTVPGVADVELTKKDQYENYQQWLKLLNTAEPAKWEWGTEDLWYGFNNYLGIANYSLVNDDVFQNEYRAWSPAAADEAQYHALMGEDSLYGPDPLQLDPYISVYDYAFKVYDSTTGKKYFELEDGYIHPTKPLTVEDAAEYALKFYHFPSPMKYPEYIAPEDMGAYNPEIITEDLLTKQTDLPEVSCAKLPASWHGVVMDDMTDQERQTYLDNRIYEYEIRAVKEAGFNFIGLELDFSWLQESILQDAKTYDCYEGFISSEDAGKFSVSRLEQLDQVIAWCMKYDIHVNLRAVSMGGYAESNRERQYSDIARASSGAKLAACWQAIARRYAEIPNEYMSFTLFTSSVNAMSPTSAVLMPSVEAIREVSPDRCIIADMIGWQLKKNDAEAFAMAGVALSNRVGTLEKLGPFFHRDAYLYNGSIFCAKLTAAGESLIWNFEWPYQGTMDAEALFATKEKDRVNETIAVAEEYGVGYMLSDFGITLNPYQRLDDMTAYPNYRYPDEGYKAMIVDITSTIAEKGYGWCFANWYGYFGIANGFPMAENVVYEQVEDYPYYIDTAMLSWFQEINGVT